MVGRLVVVMVVASAAAVVVVSCAEADCTQGTSVLVCVLRCLQGLLGCWNGGSTLGQE